MPRKKKTEDVKENEKAKKDVAKKSTSKKTVEKTAKPKKVESSKASLKKTTKTENAKKTTRSTSTKNTKKETTKTSKSNTTKTKKAQTPKKKASTTKPKKKEEVVEEKQEEVELKEVTKAKLDLKLDDLQKTIQNVIPKAEIEKIYKTMFYNILIAIAIIVYFIFLNLGYLNIVLDTYITDLKVFSITILVFSIILLEKGYNKKEKEYAIHGIEMICLAIITLALIYASMFLGARYLYLLAGISYIIGIYYVLKVIVIYLKGRKNYLVNDMKKMMKKEEE